jgi:hypothetical protein
MPSADAPPDIQPPQQSTEADNNSNNFRARAANNKTKAHSILNLKVL